MAGRRILDFGALGAFFAAAHTSYELNLENGFKSGTPTGCNSPGQAVDCLKIFGLSLGTHAGAYTPLRCGSHCSTSFQSYGRPVYERPPSADAPRRGDDDAAGAGTATSWALARTAGHPHGPRTSSGPLGPRLRDYATARQAAFVITLRRGRAAFVITLGTQIWIPELDLDLRLLQKIAPLHRHCAIDISTECSRVWRLRRPRTAGRGETRGIRVRCIGHSSRRTHTGHRRAARLRAAPQPGYAWSRRSRLAICAEMMLRRSAGARVHATARSRPDRRSRPGRRWESCAAAAPGRDTACRGSHVRSSAGLCSALVRAARSRVAAPMSLSG
jgi:hypothetical protein